MDYMEKFAGLKLLRNSNINYFKDSKRPYLYLEDPHILARFSGFLKKNLWKNAESKVFIRGQIKDYGTMIPSLFRGSITLEKLRNRHSAYNELITELPKVIKATRFKENTVGPLLQHYGIRTPWLDLVDNLYVAVWFATKDRTELKKNKFGWIYFIRTRLKNGSELRWEDLREKQSSLSLRLHVQHAISVTRNDNTVWDLTNRDLNNFIVASVKFPLNDDWNLKGSFFDREYMFPKADFDNTYKYLKKKKFSDLINSITEKYNLSDGELGRIND